MIRYGLAAMALKAFSLNSVSKRVYRRMGNALGGKSRQNTDLGIYVERANLMIDMYRKHGSPRAGDHLLELGTGWMHWFAVYLRLFFEARVTALDVWDNRQFDAFKSCFARLRQQSAEAQIPHAGVELLDRVSKAKNFDEAYAALNLDYVLVPDGSLKQFGDASFSSIFSMHVLEHVPRSAVPTLTREMFRTIKPGRIMVHQIGIDDHLSHYDSTVSDKQYIAYTDKTWSRFFENDVQYINRLQMSDWLAAFQQAGFVLLEKVVLSTSLDGLRISPTFQRYSQEDLACTNLTVVLRRP